MNVLIACEESQTICLAFRELGHNAFSCDLQPCSGGYPEYHIQGDALKEAYSGKYDLMIGHPPCTRLSYAGTGSWNLPGAVFHRLAALEFFAKLWSAPIEHICLENPRSCASPVIAKYSQEIQPYLFGDSHLKTTWLWLKNLEPLVFIQGDDLFDYSTAVNRPVALSVDNTSRNKKRYYTDSFLRSSKSRSKSFPGIARAMAAQWGQINIETKEA